MDDIVGHGQYSKTPTMMSMNSSDKLKMERNENGRKWPTEMEKENTRLTRIVIFPINYGIDRDCFGQFSLANSLYRIMRFRQVLVVPGSSLDLEVEK